MIPSSKFEKKINIHGQLIKPLEVVPSMNSSSFFSTSGSLYNVIIKENQIEYFELLETHVIVIHFNWKIKYNSIIKYHKVIFIIQL